MKPQELLEEINRLPLKERVEIAAAIFESIRSEESKTEAEVHGTPEKLSERLRGVLTFEGGSPTDDEVKDMITDYLVEKYS